MILKAAAGVGAALLIAGWWNGDRLPPPESMLSFILADPVQTAQRPPMEPFQHEAGGTVYTIKPLFDYELTGLVVSESEADAWWNIYHKKWGDSLNVKDLCVVWGDNLAKDVYRKMSFKNLSFTCYCQFKRGTGPEDWQAFRPDQLSNNHVLPSNAAIRRAIMSTRRGDQVRLSGYLCEYSHGGGFHRGTSTIRTDDGNGACETIFVTDYEIVAPANRVWHAAHALGLLLLAGSGAWLVVSHLVHAKREAAAMEELRRSMG
ncbi:MAG: hypothetical protein SF028_14280 [Candidatus Sumerlaeia bacterium]|nr:hypothetical protein [Candidatus Sumerlaeia bacterium]